MKKFKNSRLSTDSRKLQTLALNMQTTKWKVWANFRYLFVSLPQTLQLRNDLDTPYWRLEACSRQRACISDIIHGHEQSFWLITSKFVTGKVESLWAVWPRFGINAIIFWWSGKQNKSWQLHKCLESCQTRLPARVILGTAVVERVSKLFILHWR